MGRYDGYYGGFAPYVTVAERRRKAAKALAAAQRRGKTLSPVLIDGRAIARTFWGKAWCANLEAYSDFSNRLPRGRSYVRQGSVIDLQITQGRIVAQVSGSSIYSVEIAIRALDRPRWNAVLGYCSGQIDSLVELLQGRFSKGVMEIITCRSRGLFPAPNHIEMDCSCPDGATMCKHVAAVLYGVGARLDEKPELFFQLRNVDHAELISAGTLTVLTDKAKPKPGKTLQSTDLSSIFGIDIDAGGSEKSVVSPVSAKNKKTAVEQTVAAPQKGATRGEPVAVAAKRTKASVPAKQRPAEQRTAKRPVQLSHAELGRATKPVQRPHAEKGGATKPVKRPVAGRRKAK